MAEDDSSKARWRLFEIRYSNLLSITKAQKVHLTTLLIEMTLFWTWYLSGAREISVQGVSLTAQGVWFVAPAVLTFFSLVFVGSINAALPANHKLQELAEKTIRAEFPSDMAFYDLDTDKNAIDYLTFLKLSSTDNRFEPHAPYHIGHFLYPSVLLCAFGTTLFALWHIPRPILRVAYLLVCIALELLFVRRPISRAFRRFVKDPDVDRVPG